MSTDQPSYVYTEATPLRTNVGPVSFGTVVAGALVSWSAPDAADLFFSRCWDGAWIYPSAELSDQDFAAEPIRMLESTLYLLRAFVGPPNGYGSNDLFLTDRPGSLYVSRATGAWPNPAFTIPEPLRDANGGLVFNIPHEKSNGAGASSQSGYIDPAFFCYAYPEVFPIEGDPGTHLIVGDVTGNLWWMRDVTEGRGFPSYRGVAYKKPAGGIKYGIRYRERFGLEYAKPRSRLVDSSGEPIRTGYDSEYQTLPGGNSKPCALPRPDRGTPDLLVLASGNPTELLYFAFSSVDTDGMPRFADPVPVETEGFDRSTIGFHSPVFVNRHDYGETILIAAGWKVAVLRRTSALRDTPRYRFERYITARDAVACGYNFTEILKNDAGTRFMLDSAGRPHVRRIMETEDGPRLDAEHFPLRDQLGEIRLPSETDIRARGTWGLQRIARWTYHGSRAGRQDLIVGTDVGSLLLLRAADHSGAPDCYTVFGPLTDESGLPIKIHNRACAAAVPGNTPDQEDLIVCGASYQMGIPTDPDPGAGYYYVRNLGIGPDGVPLLAHPVKLSIKGFEPGLDVNQNLQIQSVDIDGDGSRSIIVGMPHDGYRGRIMELDRDTAALVYTGRRLPALNLQARFLDYDGDGYPEYVRSGGEVGRGSYERIVGCETSG